ncbi:unnamed protein product [Merluccius merluccius]
MKPSKTCLHASCGSTHDRCTIVSLCYTLDISKAIDLELLLQLVCNGLGIKSHQFCKCQKTFLYLPL